MRKEGRKKESEKKKEEGEPDQEGSKTEEDKNEEERRRNQEGAKTKVEGRDPEDEEEGGENHGEPKKGKSSLGEVIIQNENGG